MHRTEAHNSVSLISGETPATTTWIKMHNVAVTSGAAPSSRLIGPHLPQAALFWCLSSVSVAWSCALNKWNQNMCVLLCRASLARCDVLRLTHVVESAMHYFLSRRRSAVGRCYILFSLHLLSIWDVYGCWLL